MGSAAVDYAATVAAPHLAARGLSRAGVSVDEGRHRGELGGDLAPPLIIAPMPLLGALI